MNIHNIFYDIIMTLFYIFYHDTIKHLSHTASWCYFFLNCFRVYSLAEICKPGIYIEMADGNINR